MTEAWSGLTLEQSGKVADSMQATGKLVARAMSQWMQEHHISPLVLLDAACWAFVSGVVVEDHYAGLATMFARLVRAGAADEQMQQAREDKAPQLAQETLALYFALHPKTATIYLDVLAELPDVSRLTHRVTSVHSN